MTLPHVHVTLNAGHYATARDAISAWFDGDPLAVPDDVHGMVAALVDFVTILANQIAVDRADGTTTAAVIEAAMTYRRDVSLRLVSNA
jgi:hypothetical protein